MPIPRKSWNREIPEFSWEKNVENAINRENKVCPLKLFPDYRWIKLSWLFFHVFSFNEKMYRHWATSKCLFRIFFSSNSDLFLSHRIENTRGREFILIHFNVTWTMKKPPEIPSEAIYLSVYHSGLVTVTTRVQREFSQVN